MYSNENGVETEQHEMKTKHDINSAKAIVAGGISAVPALFFVWGACPQYWLLPPLSAFLGYRGYIRYKMFMMNRKL